uniref:Tetratricopeptide repeat domain-containing protein n=2 Tax=Chloropicon primus TaxID=1764295 RepID=A0A7S2T1G4_9CHLO|mmetsp:Transcript_3389/g.9464  ORF Transcript_3389/g.9464 Transcript_3389/m.9464 type:complete len:278 (+) Transcript_3389:255-1088(+)
MTTTAMEGGLEEGQRKKAQVLKERGNSFYVRHQFRQAIEWYTKALDANPVAYDVWTNRASTYAALRMWEEGLADAREAVRINPNWVKGHWRAGVCLVNMNQHKEAKEAFECGLRMSPHSEQIKQELRAVEEHLKTLPTSAEEAKRQGNAHFKEGNFEKAIKLYKESISLLLQDSSKEEQSMRAALLINTAECYRQVGEYEQVVETCDRAIGTGILADNRNLKVKAHLRRGLALEKLERFNKAREDFRVALELEPTNHIASTGLIRCAKANRLVGGSQ